jgi:hypothetical protein
MQEHQNMKYSFRKEFTLIVSFIHDLTSLYLLFLQLRRSNYFTVNKKTFCTSTIDKENPLSGQNMESFRSFLVKMVVR